jgi:hypothetical protein
MEDREEAAGAWFCLSCSRGFMRAFGEWMEVGSLDAGRERQEEGRPAGARRRNGAASQS